MDRITLTLPVINNAWNVIFLVSGQKKRGVMKEMREGHDRTLPASMVSPEKGKLLFLMDREAAG
jgi:6-phosphogluconolactonase